jgi:hypothetical protein
MAIGGAHSQSPRFFGQAQGTLNLMIGRTHRAAHPIETEPSRRLWYF